MIIEVNNLKKEYTYVEKKTGFVESVRSFIFPEKKIIKAVNGISFVLEEGEIVGFIGRNGAGKSTTIKILSGILYPSSGIALVNQIEPYKNKKQNAKDMGVVFGQRTQLWWDLPVVDTFQLMRIMYNVAQNDYSKRLEMFVEIFNMSEYLNKPVRQLSLGQRMCAELCAAMLHNPKIIYLDEPTIGLDIVNKDNIRLFIKNINKEFNTTVILTSHDIDDIELLADRIIIIEEGILIYDNDLKSIKKDFNYIEEVSFRVRDYKTLIQNKYFDNLNVTCFLNDEKEVVCSFPNTEYKVINIINAVSKYSEIYDIKIKGFTLEDIIKTIYRKEK